MSKEKIFETIYIFALEIISNYRRTGSVCENDTFNSKFEPGEMIFDCFGFSFLISASTFFNVKKKINLKTRKSLQIVCHTTPQHQAIRLDLMVNFLASLCDAEVWRVLGVLQCLTEQ